MGCTRPRIILRLPYVTFGFDISWFAKTATTARIVILTFMSCSTVNHIFVSS